MQLSISIAAKAILLCWSHYGIVLFERIASTWSYAYVCIFSNLKWLTNYLFESWLNTKLILRSLFWLFSLYLNFSFFSRLICSFYLLVCTVLYFSSFSDFFHVYVLSIFFFFLQDWSHSLYSISEWLNEISSL